MATEPKFIATMTGRRSKEGEEESGEAEEEIVYDGAAMSLELICSKVCFGTVAATLTPCVEAIAKHHLSLARMAAGVTIDVAIDAPCPKPTEPPWERKSARVGTAVIPGAKHTAAEHEQYAWQPVGQPR